jgi:hypothetical protein
MFRSVYSTVNLFFVEEEISFPYCVSRARRFPVVARYCIHGFINFEINVIFILNSTRKFLVYKPLSLHCALILIKPSPYLENLKTGYFLRIKRADWRRYLRCKLNRPSYEGTGVIELKSGYSKKLDFVDAIMNVRVPYQ